MTEGAWKRPRGATRAHWFDTRAGWTRSACRRYDYNAQDVNVIEPDVRECWECDMNKCPTDDHPLGRCTGDHGK
jgi:hypothetical protein